MNVECRSVSQPAKYLRASLPPTAFALEVFRDGEMPVRLFAHHDESGDVDKEALFLSFRAVPRAAVDAHAKQMAWDHLVEHAVALGLMAPEKPSEGFKDGPQQEFARLLMREDGGASGMSLMSHAIHSSEASALAEVLERGQDLESGRPTMWFQVMCTGRRFVNGSWIEVVHGSSDATSGTVGMDDLIKEFQADLDNGKLFFADYEHGFWNRDGNILSMLSAGDILGWRRRDVEDGGACLDAKIKLTARNARMIADGEVNLTSVAISWGGMNNLVDPPTPRGPRLENLAFTNNAAWEGQPRVGNELMSASPDDGPKTDGVREPPRVMVHATVELSDGESLFDFVGRLAEAVDTAAMSGMFGAVSGMTPWTFLVEVYDQTVVVSNREEGDEGLYIADWSIGDSGQIVLTNTRKGRKVYVNASADQQPTGETMFDINTLNEIEDVTQLRSAVTELHDEKTELGSKLEQALARIEAKKEAPSQDDAAVIEIQRLREELEVIKEQKHEADRDVSMGICKSSGLPEALRGRVEDVFDRDGQEGVDAFMSDLKAAGALAPMRQRAGHGAVPEGSNEADPDLKAAARRKIRDYRKEFSDANDGRRMRTADAMAKLRRDDKNLAEAYGVTTLIAS